MGRKLAPKSHLPEHRRWAKGAAEAMKQIGIIKGRGGNRYMPNLTDTRAEAAVVILRMLER